MPDVLVLGGTGQIGQALAPRFTAAGWNVTVASRGRSPLPARLAELGVTHVAIDRSRPEELARAVGEGVDLLVDAISFTAADAQQLVELGDRAGSLIAVSSAAVYADDQGRSLDIAEDVESFPDFPVPIPESQRTVPAGDATYATRKVAMEQVLLAGAVPATILRPCSIYGRGSTLAREWYFVKRCLDGRRAIVLSDGGRSRFHTSSVENIAALALVSTCAPASRILNCGDPDPPTVLEISRAVAATLEHEWTEVLLPRPVFGGVGANPWACPRPLVLDMAASEALGYEPVVRYEEAVVDVVRWLEEETREHDWRELMPRAAQVMADDFDYGAEDELIRSLGS